eukprot:scaffold32330_cov30-Tisochrysis_lutea.AAC.4
MQHRSAAPLGQRVRGVHETEPQRGRPHCAKAAGQRWGRGTRGQHTRRRQHPPISMRAGRAQLPARRCRARRLRTARGAAALPRATRQPRGRQTRPCHQVALAICGAGGEREAECAKAKKREWPEHEEKEEPGESGTEHSPILEDEQPLEQSRLGSYV